MTSEELALEVAAFLTRVHWPAELAAFVRACQERILGVGHQQYAEGQQQKFEALPFLRLVEMTIEELLDQANYATMCHIRIRRLRAASGDASREPDPTLDALDHTLVEIANQAVHNVIRLKRLCADPGAAKVNKG